MDTVKGYFIKKTALYLMLQEAETCNVPLLLSPQKADKSNKECKEKCQFVFKRNMRTYSTRS